MKKIQRIVFATDFSETSKCAETIALEIRDGLKAELDIIHVYNPIYDPEAYQMPEPYYFIPASNAWLSEQLAALRKKGKEHLMKYASELEPSTPHFLEGRRPGKEIIEFADNHDADLIIMGTHGHGGLSRLLVGSVADYVIRHSSVGVLTIKCKS